METLIDHVKRFFSGLVARVMFLFFLVIVFANTFQPYTESEYYDYNRIFLIIGTVFSLFLLLCVYKFLSEANDKTLYTVTVICFVVMIILQVAYQHQSRSVIFWDYAHMHANAISINENGSLVNPDVYNDMYSFFLAPTLVIRWIFLFADLFHVNYDSAIEIANIICLNATVFLTYKIIKATSAHHIAVMCVVLSALNMNLYMRTSYFYSDTMALPLLCGGLLLYLYMLKSQGAKRYLFFIAMTLLFGIAYQLRTTAFIMLIAILIHFFFTNHWKQALKFGGIFALVFLISLLSFRPIENRYLDNPIPHPFGFYLVTGSYFPDHGGGGDPQGSELLGIHDTKILNEQSKEILAARWEENGLSGFANLWYNKIIKQWTTAFNGAKRTVMQAEYNYPFFSFFYSDRSRIVMYYCQIYRSAVYILGAASCLKWIRDKWNPVMFCSFLYLLGYIVFHIFWQSSPRLYFMMVPVIMMVSAYGIECIHIRTIQPSKKKRATPCIKDKVQHAVKYATVFSLLVILLFGTMLYNPYTKEEMTHTQWTIRQERANLRRAILPDETTEQIFETKNPFGEIRLFFDGYQDEITTNYMAELYDIKNEQIIQSWPFSDASVNINDGLVQFVLDSPVIPQGRQSYSIRVYGVDSTPDVALRLKYRDPGSSHYDVAPNGYLILDGVVLPYGDAMICVLYHYRAPFFSVNQYVLFASVLFLAVLVTGIVFYQYYIGNITGFANVFRWFSKSTVRRKPQK